MRLIGSSIQDAIDWTQDHLRTTRPLAERTLFSMLADKKVKETGDGFMLVEAEGEEEAKKRHSSFKAHGQHGRGPGRPRLGFRFHKARKASHKHVRDYYKMRQLKRLDHSDEAEGMIDHEDEK